MKTLYINLNGENVVSNDEVVVVGTEKDSIVNKFYIALGTEICDGVIVKGVKKKQLVAEFESERPKDFKPILEQWNEIRYKLLSSDPSGSYNIKIPNAYLEWLQYHQNAEYRKIYTQKFSKQKDVSIKLDIGQLYEDTLDLLISNIEPGEYNKLVVGDDFVTRKSAIVQSIKADYPKIAFVLLEEFEWSKKMENGGNDKIGTEPTKEGAPKRPSKYDEIDSFHGGYARVEKDGKYGYIDINGREIIECNYSYAGHFSDGLAYIGNNTFIDEDGRIALRVKGNLIVCGDFSEGLCKVQEKTNHDNEIGMYGFIDIHGDLVIDCQFENANDFHDGYALVWDEEDEENEYGDYEVNFRFIDTDGYDAFGSFDFATNFHDGYAVVQEKEYEPWEDDSYTLKTRILDTKGNTVFDDFPEGSSIRVNGALGYHENINEGLLYFHYGFHPVYYAWIDIENGTQSEISSEEYPGNWGGFSEGLKIVQSKQGKIGFVDVYGDNVIKCQFEEAELFSEGLAAVKRNELWGYIDTNGKVIIPFKYSEAHDFSEGRAVVVKDNTLMVIDTEGNQIV